MRYRVGVVARLVAPSAAVATTSTATTAAATAAATIFARARFVHGEGAAVMFFEIQAFDRGRRLGIGAHLNETEAFAAAGVAIHDHLGTLHAAKLGKQLVQ